ncbi:hypothetical protein ACPCUV_21080 [Streptomyces platensis]|uniref:hypothetical protein n=1 Tax=Streptomyces platensis TaxID=58346 RepID=UPI003C2B7A90
MTWTTTRDLTVCDAAAGAFLRGRPIAHTVLPSVASRLRALGADAYGDDAPLFGWWRPDGRAAVGAAFVWTPPRPVLLSPMPEEAAGPLVEALAAEGVTMPGANGRRAVAEAVVGRLAAAARRSGDPHGAPSPLPAGRADPTGARATRHRPARHHRRPLTPAAAPPITAMAASRWPRRKTPPAGLGKVTPPARNAAAGRAVCLCG